MTVLLVVLLVALPAFVFTGLLLLGVKPMTSGFLLTVSCCISAYLILLVTGVSS